MELMMTIFPELDGMIQSDIQISGLTLWRLEPLNNQDGSSPAWLPNFASRQRWYSPYQIWIDISSIVVDIDTNS